ncbi:hypothetical protein [Pseudomonas aeruginosa]|uniref:hypothetical protein n=1 Tax=Pseudomonas aeruginosa TaxID=287 RepID=UPI001EE774BA|nr:hypothetical protein [Pseudomonas aeruginosa]
MESTARSTLLLALGFAGFTPSAHMSRILRGLRIHLLPEAPVLHQIASQAAEVTAIGPVPQPEPLPFVEGKLDVATALGGALEASQVLHIATARIDDDIAYP